MKNMLITKKLNINGRIFLHPFQVLTGKCHRQELAFIDYVNNLYKMTDSINENPVIISGINWTSETAISNIDEVFLQCT